MLSTEILLLAYRSGIFPMALNEAGDIGWFSPDPRALIPLDERFRVPHGSRRALRSPRFELKVDSDFEGVIRGCSAAHGSTWISKEIVHAYCELHRAGYAHSVEAWKGGELVGGLYGVHIGGAFFGESMFHKVSDASKVALVTLVSILRRNGFVLLDTQWMTPHLEQFGTYLVPKTEYLALLDQAVELPCPFELPTV